MVRSEVYDAATKAERFAKLARQLLAQSNESNAYTPAGADAAAVKRASMELTRSLAIIRR